MRPCNGMVMIEPVKRDVVTPGGLIIPDAERLEFLIGRVVDFDPALQMLPYHIGQLVAFHMTSVREVMLGGKIYKFIHNAQVMAFADDPTPLN